MLNPERPSALVATVCLMVGGFALSTGNGAEPRPAIVAMISPQEAQQWVGVVFDALNKVCGLVNVAMGMWQAAMVVHHRRKARAKPQDTPPGGGGPGPEVGRGPPVDRPPRGG